MKYSGREEQGGREGGDVPRIKPANFWTRSMMAERRFWKTAKTDSKAERMVLKIEEMRLEMDSNIPGMVVVLGVVLVWFLRGVDAGFDVG